MMDQMIYKANEKGGRKYKFHGFNIFEGARTQKQNQELCAYVEDTLKELYASVTLIGEPHWKSQQGFILDTRTGLILPFY